MIMLRLQIFIASTRPGRKGDLVGRWFEGEARRHGGFEIEMVDLATVDLPLFDEPRHPRLRQYEQPHTHAWSAVVARADAFVFVTPEYDHVPPASLLNALQFLVHEWAYKPLGFVSYGGVSAGTRSVQVLKQIAVALKMMPIPEAVHIPFFQQFVTEDVARFEPQALQGKAAKTMLDELVRWARALESLRLPAGPRAEDVKSRPAVGR